MTRNELIQLLKSEGIEFNTTTARLLSKSQLEALVNATDEVRNAFGILIAERNEKAKTNQRLAGRLQISSDKFTALIKEYEYLIEYTEALEQENKQFEFEISQLQDNVNIKVIVRR